MFDSSTHLFLTFKSATSDSAMSGEWQSFNGPQGFYQFPLAMTFLLHQHPVWTNLIRCMSPWCLFGLVPSGKLHTHLITTIIQTVWWPCLSYTHSRHSTSVSVCFSYCIALYIWLMYTEFLHSSETPNTFSMSMTPPLPVNRAHSTHILALQGPWLHLLRFGVLSPDNTNHQNTQVETRLQPFGYALVNLSITLKLVGPAVVQTQSHNPIS